MSANTFHGFIEFGNLVARYTFDPVVAPGHLRAEPNVGTDERLVENVSHRI